VVLDLRLCPAGTKVTLLSAHDFLNNQDFEFTDRVMQFNVIDPNVVPGGVDNEGKGSHSSSTSYGIHQCTTQFCPQ